MAPAVPKFIIFLKVLASFGCLLGMISVLPLTLHSTADVSWDPETMTDGGEVTGRNAQSGSFYPAA